MSIGVNPLVVAATEGGKTSWTGIYLAEDIQLLHQAFETGSWVDGVLGGVGATLDVLGLVTDPLGTIAAWGVAWLLEHVKPLSDALDKLAGNPGQIGGHAATWRNVARQLEFSAGDYRTAVSRGLDQWQGAAAEAYRNHAGEYYSAMGAAARAADLMATITEGAGMLVALVRTLVRDAIAEFVSVLAVRLWEWLAEVAATVGLGTPWVIAQVSALVGRWGAKIARFIKGLINSLRNLTRVARRLDDIIRKLIQEIKRLLGKLRPGGRRPPHRPPRPPTRKELLDELARLGIKHNPDDIVKIAKDANGKIIFLERGHSEAGLQHILEHADDFANVGIPRERIADVVFDAVQQGHVVGTQGKGTGRQIYQIIVDGKTYDIAISVGSNGYIVGANPTGRPR